MPTVVDFGVYQGVCGKTGEGMDHCIEGRSVLQPHVLLQLVEESLDSEALPEQGCPSRAWGVFNIAANSSNQVKAFPLELLHHCLGDVALIAKHLALQSGSQCRQGLAVINIGGRDLVLVVDHQMELESEEPAYGTAAPLGHAPKTLYCLPRAWQLERQ